MSPLTAIPSAMPAYGLTPRVDVAGDALPLKTPGIQSPTEVGQPGAVTQAQPASESFAGMLGRMVADVNASQKAASDAVGALQSGQNVPLHQAVIAMEEANLSFQLMVQVRNGLLDAYHEIMRMQI
jgi:flagellar hook-basal body complex protein FliE